MRNQVLIKRYAQGLINSAKDEKELESLLSQIHEFHDLLSTQKNLQEVLTSPFLPAAKKKEITAYILAKTSPGEKAKRFLLLLVDNNRLSLIRDILDQSPEVWNDEHGIATFVVSSVVPLDETQKKRLEERLARLEKRNVSLSYKIDPSLIGGLSIRKKNMVYDVSIQGDLERLKQKISEG
jgi:F-type H+-transporting ATPase subunit delta